MCVSVCVCVCLAAEGKEAGIWYEYRTVLVGCGHTRLMQSNIVFNDLLVHEPPTSPINSPVVNATKGRTAKASKGNFCSQVRTEKKFHLNATCFLHAGSEAFLESAPAALVPLLFVHGAVLAVAAGVLVVLAHGAAKETFASIAAGRAIVLSCVKRSNIRSRQTANVRRAFGEMFRLSKHEMTPTSFTRDKCPSTDCTYLSLCRRRLRTPAPAIRTRIRSETGPERGWSARWRPSASRAPRSGAPAAGAGAAGRGACAPPPPRSSSRRSQFLQANTDTGSSLELSWRQSRLHTTTCRSVLPQEGKFHSSLCGSGLFSRDAASASVAPCLSFFNFSTLQQLQGTHRTKTLSTFLGQEYSCVIVCKLSKQAHTHCLLKISLQTMCQCPLRRGRSLCRLS